MAGYEVLDEALESIADAGPDLRNGLTNHAPMAIEALTAMGRGDLVMGWLRGYRKDLLPRPAAHGRISRGDWRFALARADRFSDWRELFDEELKQAAWPVVLEKWAARLAPGIAAAATHGVIRVGHAVRTLAQGETLARRNELADGLALWASTYQALPTNLSPNAAAARPSEAIRRVRALAVEKRKFTGTITSSLEALDQFPEFAAVIGLADLSGEASASISELTSTFARVYLANARDLLSVIVFIHCVTSIAALRTMLPYLSEATRRGAMRYAWQAACALYATFGRTPTPAYEVDPPPQSRETLIDMAVANGDEHAIKFTEACLREDVLSPSPAYWAAAHHALGTLKR
jgi:hypothetical protein